MEGTSRQVEKLHFSRDMSSDKAKGEIAQISTTPNNQINIKQSQQSAENKNETANRKKFTQTRSSKKQVEN